MTAEWIALCVAFTCGASMLLFSPRAAVAIVLGWIGLIAAAIFAALLMTGTGEGWK